MIGNDLIDLDLAQQESNWRRPGYTNKIFTNPEQLAIQNSGNPDLMVWTFWSMKEAAFKIVNRKSLEKKYQPQKYACTIVRSDSNFFTGKVLFGPYEFFTQTQLHQNFIHTICSFEPQIKCKLKISLELSGKVSKEMFLENCMGTKEYFLKSKQGIPFIFNATDKKIKVASFSHHGKGLALITLK